MDRSWITDELIQNTFLYCVKRLHNTEEAKDLAQDILTEALCACRRREEQITAVYAWYWKLAHHRYCLYLRKKQYGAVSLEEVGGSLPADLPDLSEEMIVAEEISALNLSLSRLSAIHRETIIRYYLQNQTVREIAEALAVPEGTIKRRLFDAKEQIREDFTMTNTGRSAYAPAILNLQGGYGIPTYWKALQDRMTQQILIQCRREAKTIREIADEIGVAPVYFEEKMQYLLEHRFLKESGKGRYLTDFIIYPEEAYKNYYVEKAMISAGICPEMMDILFSVRGEIIRIPFYGNNFPYTYLLWIICVYAANILSRKMLVKYTAGIHTDIPKDNGKDYRVSGRVQFPEETILWPKAEELHTRSWSNFHSNFRTSGYRQICHANLFQMEPFEERMNILTDANADLFMRIFDDPGYTLTHTEEETVSFWIRHGYMKKTDVGLYPTMPVMTWEVKEKIEFILAEKLESLSQKYMTVLADAANKWLLPYVRKDLMEEYVHWDMLSAFCFVESIFYYAMDDTKLLAMPEDFSASAAGICIYVHK